ncbi:hypothetical protein [Glycomyces dulcitolivorans]|uniref:hypothetical protein n=1 Tax=Glycomyces dulcitolivorans TaxID=2200759 RepID=UPI00130069EE|nr:hypothetical protein [Glycomyces dulcitolivorans]
MTTTTSSSGPRNHTRTTALTADSATRPPGPEVMAEALPFDTIPAEVLRDHFTKWLLESLTHSALQAAAQAATPATADEVNLRAGEPALAAAEPQPPGETGIPPTPAAPTAAESPAAAPPASKPKQPKAKNRPPSRKREGPLSDAMDPPPPAPPLREPDSESRSESPPPRPQYVRIGDRSVWLTKPMLRSRGWTEAAIRDFLPGPEALKPNPRFAVSGAPMPVWKPETVARAEADPEWRAWLERSLQRRQTTLEALADTDDPEFRTRLELADQAIKDRTAPPTLLDAFEPASPALEPAGANLEPASPAPEPAGLTANRGG